ncbi:hypothetical protein CHLRE_03g179600v5 [Chlamydomonas reinhardtii]|uniref:Uncharacterized protein n=1 Tax=Chlamydomonas reinhardtii TaxID=3055 RepID=A0A2K3DXP1_CHLRE|nr:uncharacterized protein CHLRE_03g179600v5 [Chlamydomonas reinhardtii]PNW85287.1 hypothetical protein CHLRE_03g179600v5 [Chlamydomonas reinhardtii]
MSNNMSLTDAFFDLYGPPKNNGNGQPDSARSLGQAAQYVLGVDFPSGPWSPRFGLATPGAGYGSSASAEILNALGMVDNMTPRLLTGTHEPFPSSFSSELQPQHQQTEQPQQQQPEELAQMQHHHQRQHLLPQPPQLQLQPLNLPPLNLPPLSFQLNPGANATANTFVTDVTLGIHVKAEPRVSVSSGPLPAPLQQQLLLQQQSSDVQQRIQAEPPQQPQQQASAEEPEPEQLDDEDDESDSQGATTGGRGGRRRKPAAKSGRGAAKGGVGKKGQAAPKARAAAAVAAAAAAAVVEVSPGRVLYTGTVGSSGLMQTGEALPWSLSLQALNAQLAASSPPGSTAWPAEADS